MEEAAPRRPWFWLFAIAGAIAGFLYVAVYDVRRVHGDGPSLANEELLILARHGALERGAEVRCEDQGQAVVGQVFGLPGELAIASAAGVRVPKRAQDRLGAPLERLSVSQPNGEKRAVATASEDDLEETRIAADPGHLLISGDGAPRAVRAAKCLPVLKRIKVASLLPR